MPATNLSCGAILNTLREFWKLLRTYVTVEPVLFLYIFGFGLTLPVNQALVYRKVCLSIFDDNETVCNNLTAKIFHRQEKEVQDKSSHFILYEGACFTLPAIFTSTFYGSLSDKLSRKIPILLPLTGQLLNQINLIFVSSYSTAPYQLVLLGTLVSSLFGGLITCISGVFSYISDVTDQKGRVIRIGVAEAMIAIGFATSQGISGVLLDNTNFATVYCTSLLSCVLGIIITVFWVKTFRKTNQEETQTKNHSLVKEICNVDNLKGSVKCVLKAREDNGRKHILLILTAVFFSFIGNGARALTYLYVTKEPLKWSTTTFGIYNAFGAVAHGISLLVLLPLAKKLLKIKDSILACAGFVSQALAEALFGFCTVTWMVFIVPLVGILAPMGMASIRAIISFMVEKDEQGKLFSVVSSLEYTSILLAMLIHNNLYPVTYDFWPGFVFAFGACLMLIPISLIIWFHFAMKRSISYQTMKESGPAPQEMRQPTDMSDKENGLPPEGLDVTASEIHPDLIDPLVSEPGESIPYDTKPNDTTNDTTGHIKCEKIFDNASNDAHPGSNQSGPWDTMSFAGRKVPDVHIEESGESNA